MFDSKKSIRVLLLGKGRSLVLWLENLEQAFISSGYSPAIFAINGGNWTSRLRSKIKYFDSNYQRVNEIVNQRRGITPSTALRLAKFFGMSADFWVNLQLRWDLYRAQKAEYRILDSIHPHISVQ